MVRTEAAFPAFFAGGPFALGICSALVLRKRPSGTRLRPYDFSLDGIDNQERARYTYSWSWSLLTAIKELLRHPLVSFKAILFSKEGNPGVLTVAALCGRIGMLMRTRKQYKSHLLEIQRFSARVRGQAAKTNPPAVAYATTGSATVRAGRRAANRFAATPDTDGSSLPAERTITRGDGAESCRPHWSDEFLNPLPGTTSPV